MAIVHLRILPASTHYQFSSHFHILHIYYTSIPVPVTKICMFPMPAVTNPHRSGSLKNNRTLFSHISEGRILNQSVVRFHAFWRLYGWIHSLSLPGSGGCCHSLAWSHIIPITASIFTKLSPLWDEKGYIYIYILALNPYSYIFSMHFNFILLEVKFKK